MSYFSFSKSGIAASAALALALMAAPAAAQQVQKVKVAHAGTGATYLSMYAAIDKGYYKAQNIEVERQDAAGGVSTPALMAGDLDFTFSASVAVGAIMKGARLKVVFVTGDRPTYQIWAGPKDNSIEDMKGQQIGIISRGDTSEIAMRAFLLKRGLSGNYVAYTPLGFSNNRLAALFSGALPVSIVLVNERDQVQNDPQKRAHLLYDMVGDVRMVFSGVATTDALIAKDPDLVRRFVMATQQGMALIKSNKKEAVRILMKYANYKEEVADHDVDLNVANFLATGIATDEVQNNETKVRLEMLEMDKAPPLSQIFNMSFAQAGVKKMADDKWKPE